MKIIPTVIRTIEMYATCFWERIQKLRENSEVRKYMSWGYNAVESCI